MSMLSHPLTLVRADVDQMQPLDVAAVAVYANTSPSAALTAQSGSYANATDNYGVADDADHGEVIRKGSITLALAKASEPPRVGESHAPQTEYFNLQAEVAPPSEPAAYDRAWEPLEASDAPKRYTAPSRRSAVVRFSDTMWLETLLFHYRQEMSARPSARMFSWLERNPMPALGCSVCNDSNPQRPVRFP